MGTPFPVFLLPLRKGDDETPVDLGTVLHDLHERASYDLAIDYSAEPVPPLDEADAAWGDELLREAGLNEISIWKADRQDFG